MDPDNRQGRGSGEQGGLRRPRGMELAGHPHASLRAKAETLGPSLPCPKGLGSQKEESWEQGAEADVTLLGGGAPKPCTSTSRP